MKNFKQLYLLIITFCAISVQNVYGISINFMPGEQTVTLGEQASVDIVVSGLDDSTALGDYDFEFSFDHSIVSLSDIIFGDALGFSLPEASASGIFDASWESPDDLLLLQANTFTLATLVFDTLSLGSTFVGIETMWALGDQFGDPLDWASTNAKINVIGGGGDVNPVPIPGSMYLMMIGLSSAGYLVRRQKRAPI